MRKSKPAAMCLKVEDVLDWLSPGYSLLTSDFQPEPEDFNTLLRLNERGDLMAFIPRVDCETDFNYLQLLPYAVVMTHDGRIIGYNRPTKGGGEVRLAGNFSIGFGGHVELEDAVSALGCDVTDTLDRALLRELDEEIRIEENLIGLSRHVYSLPSLQDFRLLGIIRSQESDVDRVHLGLVYLVVCDISGMSEPVATTPEPDQVINPRILTLEEARAEASPESWTAKILNSSVLDQMIKA